MASMAKSVPGLVAALAAAALSFFGSARLLWAVNVRLGPDDRRRLFPRQLRSLATASLLISIVAFPIVCVDLWHMDEAFSELVCQNVYHIFRPLRFASVLQETHMALTFLAQLFRSTRLLRCMNHGIPALWILALLLGVADAVLLPFHLDPYGVCYSTSLHVDVISICLVSFCVLTSCVASAATLAKASASFTSLAVQRRSFKRAVWYPCISVLSYTPIMIAYGFPDLFRTQFLPFACVCEFGNGAMNAGMFFLQSHYASRLGARSDENDNVAVDGVRADADVQYVASFDVLFGDVDVVELLESRRSAASDC